MLVLSRLRDETIMIGDDIEITVVDIRGDKVRLGISAPSRVAVHRKEVYDAIKAENEQAARAADLPALPVRPAASRAARIGSALKAAGDLSMSPPSSQSSSRPIEATPARKRA
jgi:carbon storage regulator